MAYFNDQESTVITLLKEQNYRSDDILYMLLLSACKNDQTNIVKSLMNKITSIDTTLMCNALNIASNDTNVIL